MMEQEILLKFLINVEDLDLMLTGWSFPGLHAILYTNDGDGNFTEIINTPFLGVNESSIEFGDVDADGDLDLIVAGRALFK